MARMPGVEWDPLPENQIEQYINPSQVIIHTAVDGNVDIPAYFRRRDIFVESHFWITGNGRITQLVDTHRQADAQYRANFSAISIETEDDGDPEGNPWTYAQMQSLVRVIRWASKTHGIPIRRCRTSTAPGIGWHSMWSYPTDPINLRGRPVPSPWTTALGMTCPGRTRIRQLVNTVIPMAAGGDEPTGDDPPPANPTLREGSRGPATQTVQRHFKLPSDGIFGPITEAAVRTFQMAQGLAIDGVVGPDTWARIDEPKSVFEQQTSPSLPFPLWLRSPHSYRSQYQALTRILNAELLLPTSPVFSARTDAATKGLQRGTELTVDGMAGRQTWGTLFYGAPDD